MVLCDFKKPLKCATHFLPLALKPSSFFLLQQPNDEWLWQCGMHTMWKGEGWGVLWNGQKTGSLSLRVKRDERVGVWWLDGVDVSVMAWCQTLCHCQCQSHQLIPQWSATVQCVSKPLCCFHFNQCVGAAVLSHFCPLSNSILIGDCHLIAVCTMSCVCVGLVDVCCVMSSDGVGCG